MNHTFTRAGGVWAPGTGLLSAELADIDAKTVDSISATGGTYLLQDDLVIGTDGFSSVFYEAPVFFGEDITATENAFFYGELRATGDVQLGGGSTTVDVFGATTFQGTAGFEATSTFNDIAIFNELVQLNGQVFVNAPIGFFDNTFFEIGSDPIFEAPTTFNGVLDANANCFLGGTGFVVELLAPTTLRQPMTMQGTGCIVQRYVIGANGNATYSPLATHEVVIMPGGITGAVQYTIDDTDCVNGQEILFTNKEPAQVMTPKRPDGTGLAGISGGWCRCKRIAGTWTIVQRGDVTTL